MTTIRRELAEKLVDAIGEALGFDTGMLSELNFQVAVDAAMACLEADRGVN